MRLAAADVTSDDTNSTDRMPVALVTGGASGLGAATVRALHAAGAGVVIVDLPQSPGAELAAELGQRAVFSPRGLWGRLYWYSLLPFHALIFGRLAARLAAAAEQAGHQHVDGAA